MKASTIVFGIIFVCVIMGVMGFLYATGKISGLTLKDIFRSNTSELRSRIEELEKFVYYPGGVIAGGVIDGIYCKIFGCNMTGDLNVTGNVTAQYFKGNGSLLTDVTADVEDVWVNESGDIMTGNLNFSADKGIKTLVGVWAYRLAPQAVPGDGGWDVVQLNTEDYDLGGDFDTSGSFTVTLNNPTEDGFIWGVCRERMNDGDYIGVGNNLGIMRGYIEWDISSIPDGSTILNTVFKYHGVTHYEDAHIHEMLGARPSISDNDTIYNEAGEGTVYAAPAGFPVVGTNKQIDLGASADADLQSQLTSDWFAIGLQGDVETDFSDIYSEERSGANPKPTLYVEYTLSPSYRFTAPVSGYYFVSGEVCYVSTVADKMYSAGVRVNGNWEDYPFVAQHLPVGAGGQHVIPGAAGILYLAEGSYLELMTSHTSVVSINIEGYAKSQVRLSVFLLSVAS